ncbi:MAG: hypothetical protein WA865_21360 [Spirulinaceae cyanobacterium]
MKYFFLADGWIVGRVWEFGGLWNANSWQRQPQINCLNLCILEQGEKLWLYQVEEAVLMVEIKPSVTTAATLTQTIGQVVLRRLITADIAIERLSKANTILNSQQLAID